jgi:hypothetical protein
VLIEPGREYEYQGARGAGTRYRVLGEATALHAFSRVVVYEGLDGADRGKLYTCPLYDFALKFRPAPEAAPATHERPAEKAAGAYEGSGV